MPIYTYECVECEKALEVEKATEDRRDPESCESCGGAALLVITPVSGFVSGPAVPSSGKVRKK